MKETIKFYIIMVSMLLCNSAFSQCHIFDINLPGNNNPLGNWVGSNAGVQVIQDFTPTNGTLYLEGSDASGASYVLNSVDFNNMSCGNLCWDYKVFKDGNPNMVSVITPSITLFINSPANPTAITFSSNTQITERSAWVTVCAPIMGYLPPNSAAGNWNATSAEWTNLMNNLGGIAFNTDVAGSSNQDEIIGIDNICFTPSDHGMAPVEPLVVMHFEDEDGIETSAFDLCEEVFLDVEIQTEVVNYFIRIVKINPDGSTSMYSSPGWIPGNPGILNITEMFGGSVNFQEGCTYEIKIAIDDPQCGWLDYTEIFTFDEDCCDFRNPSIQPYWDHPACPEEVCDANQWPIIVLNQNGQPIFNTMGITVIWDNLDTPEEENLVADFIFVSSAENWQATITYPDGCEYIRTYLQICCERDIFINAFDCSDVSRHPAFSQQIKIGKSDLNNPLNGSLENENCDPCDVGYIGVQLVDDQGNEIDPNSYDSFMWDDGSQLTSRLFFLPMSAEICFTATEDIEGELCIYEDCFYYECDNESCEDTVPINLQVSGNVLSWDPVPGAIGYVVSSPSFIPPSSCTCANPVTIGNIQTTNTSIVVPFNKRNRCFFWQVTAICANGETSQDSTPSCFNPEGGGDSVDDGDNLNGLQRESNSPNLTLERAVKIFPNPSDGNITVNFNNEVQNGQIIIRDLLGRTVFTTILEDKIINQSLDISHLNGIYFLSIKGKNIEDQVQKIIIR